MLCRAHLLIEKEHQQFLKENPWGIKISKLNEDNIFEWKARIQGLRDTVWQDGQFWVYLRFSEHYNDRPPEIFFQTIPFHPNIDPEKGELCIDFLEEQMLWKECYSLTRALITLQYMLANPVLENPINAEAARLLLHDPGAYKQLALQCVTSSKKYAEGAIDDPLNGGQKENTRVTFGIRDDPTFNTSNRSHTGRINVSKVSFEDYHKTWKDIGTSSIGSKSTNPYISTLEGDLSRLQPRPGLNEEEIDDIIRLKQEEHDRLMYGVTGGREATILRTKRHEKLQALEKMKKMYMCPRSTPPPPRGGSAADDATITHTYVPADSDGEEEAQELLDWTNSLDAEDV